MVYLAVVFWFMTLMALATKVSFGFLWGTLFPVAFGVAMIAFVITILSKLWSKKNKSVSY